jgi:hypothetical protein
MKSCELIADGRDRIKNENDQILNVKRKNN